MARAVSYQKETIPAQEMTIRCETYTCDGCGREISREDDEDFACELVVLLDPDQCVNYRRRRDYCRDCLDPIWQAICKLIKSDPDMDGDDREDDD